MNYSSGNFPRSAQPEWSDTIFEFEEGAFQRRKQSLAILTRPRGVSLQWLNAVTGKQTLPPDSADERIIKAFIFASTRPGRNPRADFADVPRTRTRIETSVVGCNGHDALSERRYLRSALRTLANLPSSLSNMGLGSGPPADLNSKKKYQRESRGGGSILQRINADSADSVPCRDSVAAENRENQFYFSPRIATKRTLRIVHEG